MGSANCLGGLHSIGTITGTSHRQTNDVQGLNVLSVEGLEVLRTCLAAT